MLQGGLQGLLQALQGLTLQKLVVKAFKEYGVIASEALPYKALPLRPYSLTRPYL